MATATTPALDLSTEGLSTQPKSKKSLFAWVQFLVSLWDSGFKTSLNLIGEAGYAKTAGVKAAAEKLGLKAIVISLAQVDWDSFFAPYPEEGDDGQRRVQILLHEDLLSDEPKLLVFDESRRAGKREQNILLEIKASGTIAGVKIPNLKGVICIDNPGASGDYAGVSGLDPAQGDRGFTVNVGIYDVPWKEWFATQFPGTEFDKVWRWHANLDVAERRVMSPRNLEHIVRLALAGFPMIVGLPVLASGREKVINARGEDTTAKVLDGLAAALGVANLPEDSLDVVALIDWSIFNGQNIRVIGPHGRGKTSYVEARVKELSSEFAARCGEPLHLEAFSAPLVSPQDLALLAPGPNGSLRHLVAERFVEPGRKYVLLVDEASRADRRIAAALMGLIQEHEIAGQHLPGMQSLIALDNPTVYRGMRFDSGRMDRAQASRFTATVTIDDDDLPWRQYFDQKYGTEAQPILDWWYEDLDDAGKAVVTFRTLERLMWASKAGMPLKPSLGVIGHDQVEVALVDLERRLANAEVIGFGKVIAEVEDYVARIVAGDADIAAQVRNAFATADPRQLEKHEDIVKEYVKIFPKDLLFSLARTKDADRQAFWARVVTVRLAS